MEPVHLALITALHVMELLASNVMLVIEKLPMVLAINVMINACNVKTKFVKSAQMDIDQLELIVNHAPSQLAKYVQAKHVKNVLMDMFIPNILKCVKNVQSKNVLNVLKIYRHVINVKADTSGNAVSIKPDIVHKSLMLLKVLLSLM